ncbi:MAG: ATP-grasp domain-containing protein [Methylococcales bacterium]|nr:ATP-grasp domain-containing protein [Methylococcales bacterium]
MAKKAGYDVVVIDCFSDVDTQVDSLECIKVKTLSIKQIEPAFCLLNSRYKLAYAIYGSGFEFYSSSLKFLHQKIKVLGNTLEAYSAIQDKTFFFSKLKQLNIPFPDISFQAPEYNDGWLVKPMRGEGGLGIKKYKGLVESSETCYWQRFINGISMSVLFVSDGSSFEICGFHKQLITSVGEFDFIFSGIISQPELNDKVKSQLNVWIASLVTEFSLKGLNSIDFILKNDCCYILEINPRPSASMQLYNDGLIDKHMSSSLQNALGSISNLKEYRAYQVVFAETDTIINNDIQWPEWLVDRPHDGSLIHTGLPICSIIARDESEQQILDKLLLKQQLVKQLLK